jgi:precorrin-6B methylase 1
MEALQRLDNIEKNLKLLQQKCRLLELENVQLHNTKRNLEKIIEKQKEEILTIEKQNKLTKIAESFSTSENNDSYRSVIDNLILEIEECIKLIKQ